jgi:hypothetical protein
MKISMTKCRTNLFILWLVCSIILVIIMWLQIAFGHYGDKGRQAIEWLLLAILLQPFVALEPLDFLTESNLVLGLLQGVVTAVIGIFFVQKVEAASS